MGNNATSAFAHDTAVARSQETSRRCSPASDAGGNATRRTVSRGRDAVWGRNRIAPTAGSFCAAPSVAWRTMRPNWRPFRLFVLGAGFSRPAGLPLGRELLDRVRCDIRDFYEQVGGWDGPLERAITEWQELYPSLVDLWTLSRFSHMRKDSTFCAFEDRRRRTLAPVKPLWRRATLYSVSLQTRPPRQLQRCISILPVA